METLLCDPGALPPEHGARRRLARSRKVRLMGRQSRGLSMVEIEESAQAVAPLHVGRRARRRWRLLQKPVVESLMVALAVVVLNVLPHEEAHVALTERDHTSETFLFDRPNKPFGVGVEIGTLRR